MLRNISFVLFVSVFLSSCITNNDLSIINTKGTEPLETFQFDYQLKAGDLLSIQISSLTPMEYDFFNKESGSNSQLYVQNPYLYGYLLDNSGSLKLPVLGSFELEGKTLSEANNIIQLQAERYFSEPSVKVNILNYYVTVLGEVNTPGRVNVIEPNTNLLEVLGLTGDLTKLANRKKIKIIRTESEKPQVYYVDLSDKNIVNSELFYLQPNDIIYVQPTMKRFVLIDNLPAAISTLFSAFTLFYLIQPN
tara:strand:- start:701 stop:1447 length:747 start_codon:yes stop_codon:yes gene_type:complete